MKVADLLKNKDQTVYSVTSDESVFAVMRKLVEYRIGALIVMEPQGRIMGIISERDILKAVYENCDTFKTKKVADLMTTNLLVAIPEDDLEYAMGIMTQNRIRHIPIVTKEGVVGIISIGDIIKFQLDETQVKNRYLEEFILG
ncbi:MAG TPA: CBS domain-containing protein [Bacillota bacterium]|nr:CBS domain-containing protein [Bacillota bacterium]